VHCDALCIAAKGVGLHADKRRFVASFDGDPAYAARLEIEFELP